LRLLIKGVKQSSKTIAGIFDPPRGDFGPKHERAILLDCSLEEPGFV